MENLNLVPFAILWGGLALSVLTLIVIRRRIALGEDDTLHVMEADARAIPRQQEIAHKLEVIDKWGKLLTIAAVAFGLVLGVLWGIQSWIAANNAALR